MSWRYVIWYIGRIEKEFSEAALLKAIDDTIKTAGVYTSVVWDDLATQGPVGKEPTPGFCDRLSPAANRPHAGFRPIDTFHQAPDTRVQTGTPTATSIGGNDA